MLQYCLSKLSGQAIHHAVLTRHGFLRCRAAVHAWAKSQQGFSLLEMLVVLGIVGVLAMGSATLLIDDGDWKRQDETEARWDAIRKAIIGEPNLSLNGSPYVAGYVADMGRLPLSISELIEQNVRFDNDGVDNEGDGVDSDGDGVDGTLCDFDHDNNNTTAIINIQQPAFGAIQIPDYTPATGFTNTVSGGWRGPYLYTAGSSFYGDGWFNQNTGNPCDFDWDVNTTPVNVANVFPDISDIRIKSLGSDRNLGGNETAQDYPANNLNTVNLNEWTLGTAPITFNIHFNRAVTDGPTPIPDDIPNPIAGLPHQLQLKIYRYADNGDNVADANDLDEAIASTTFEMIDGITQAPAQNIDLSGLPIGRFAAVIWCTGNDNLPVATANYANDVVYDGNCNEATGGNAGNIDHSPVYFTVTHHTSQVTLTWNLP